MIIDFLSSQTQVSASCQGRRFWIEHDGVMRMYHTGDHHNIMIFYLASLGNSNYTNKKSIILYLMCFLSGQYHNSLKMTNMFVAYGKTKRSENDYKSTRRTQLFQVSVWPTSW